MPIRRRLLAAGLACALSACGGPPRPQPSPTVSPTASPSVSPSASPSSEPPPAPLPSGFVDLAEVDPTILTDIRYATPHNFVGRPIDGYERPRCLLTRQAAEALHRIQQRAVERGFSLKMYDCYRPQRAVDDFVRWSGTPDEKMKAEFFPNVAKSQLFPDGYIGGPTAHSRGSTVDMTIVPNPPRTQPAFEPGQPLVACTAPADERFPDNSADMGTGFDCFDPLAHTAAEGISETARANRAVLTGLMNDGGFTNYPKEWWHYTMRGEPFPDKYFDFPV